MILILQMPPESQAKVRKDQATAARVPGALGEGMKTAVVAGGEDVRHQLIDGDLGLNMQHPASGLAASTMGWMIDANIPLGAIGVPSNSPAARYAFIHQAGGTIVPKNAKALAIPVSDQAKKYTSPRDMPQELDFVPRKGKPPLLVEILEGRGKRQAQSRVHWVLVQKVTIKATHWLTIGVGNASSMIAYQFNSRFWQVLLGQGKGAA